MMLYSCTYMATVGVKGSMLCISAQQVGTIWVSCFVRQKLKEFTGYGQTLRVISLHPDISYPWHAVGFAVAGRTLVCHGGVGAEGRRVVAVGIDGRGSTVYGLASPPQRPRPLDCFAAGVTPTRRCTPSSTPTASFTCWTANTESSRCSTQTCVSSETWRARASRPHWASKTREDCTWTPTAVDCTSATETGALRRYSSNSSVSKFLRQ